MLPPKTVLTSTYYDQILIENYGIFSGFMISVNIIMCRICNCHLVKIHTSPILDLLDAVKSQFTAVLTPAYFVTLDESMIKFFHHDLKGEVQIILNPRPIGCGIKNMSEGVLKKVLYLELYMGNKMEHKRYEKEYDATAAIKLCLAESYYGLERRVKTDSWFGSIKMEQSD